MSFLSLLGGSKKQLAPARPLAGATQTDAIHGQLSNPSRKGSMDSFASATQSKKPPITGKTLPVSSSPPAHSSTSSTSDSNKKPFRGRRSDTSREIPPSLESSPSTSTVSLVDTQEDYDDIDTPSLTTKKTPAASRSLKTSPSLEQEWMEVENDSSDEDDFSNTRMKTSFFKNKSPYGNHSASRKQLNESAVMVEDESVKARRLTTELSAVEEKLRSAKEQNNALQRQFEELETECKTKAEQLKALKESTDADKIKTARDNATAMEVKRREIQELQRSVDQLRRESKGWEERIEMLVRENDVLRKEVAGLEDQTKYEGEELEAARKEVDAANTALRSFRDRSKAAIGAEREENKRLKEKADDLWKQLEALEKHSKERDAQLHQLQKTGQSTDDAFRAAQAVADEKDRALAHSRNQVLSLEDQKEKLLEKLVALETEVEETKNASQRLLARTKEDQEERIVQVNDRVRSLQGEIEFRTANVEKLLSTLRASKTETVNATKLADDRAAEIERLQEQLGIVEEELHSREQDLIDSEAGRVSQSHLEAKIRDLNSVVEKLKADHAIERQQLENDITNERARGSKLEAEYSSSREALKTMRTRYEASEQSRRIIKDQLARREEELRNGRLGSSGNFDLSASIIRESTQPSNDQLFSLLQNLNYEIFQTSALLADALSLIDRPSSDISDAIDIIDDETTSLLGPHLLALVRSQTNIPLDCYDPYPLQTAIQATLICCATRVMTAWYPGYWEHSDFLAATYARIREAEGISASDAWKTMTRARLRPTTGTVGRVVDFFEECLTTIFRYAGWSTSTNATGAESSDNNAPGENAESLLRENREKLSSLARHSLRLNVMLDSVTPQLEPAFVEPGSVFDPYVMDRDDGSGGSQIPEDNDEVVSTSEIGLRKASIDAKGGSSSRRRVVLKPKVILRSSFEA